MLWRLAQPSDSTRQQVEAAVRAKGFDMLDMKVSGTSGQNNRNQIIIVARCRNPFGNVQKLHFGVNLWANAFGRRVVVTELTS